MNKKICMIAYTNYRYDPRTRREAEALAHSKENSVLFIVPKTSEARKTYQLDGVTVKEVNTSQYQGKSKINYILSYFKFFAYAFYECSKPRLARFYNVFHIHNMPDFLIFSALVPKLMGKKLILDIHDTMLETYKAKFGSIMFGFISWIFHFEERISCRFADHIICVNHVQKEVIVSRGENPKRITVILNVPDHQHFAHVINDHKKSEDNAKFKLVYHGTLAKRLGVDLTIEAVKKLKKEISGIEFHIYGFGDDKSIFVEIAQSFNLDRNVFFHDPVEVDKIALLLSGMDVGIIGNRSNIATKYMLPVKMLEYIALGIPVVVPRLKTIEYYFSDDMLFYYGAENVDDLARQILRVYKNKELRSKRVKAAGTFLEKYGWETHQEDLLELYRKL